MSSAFTQPDDVRNGWSGVQSTVDPSLKCNRTSSSTSRDAVAVTVLGPAALNTPSPTCKDSMGRLPSGVSIRVPSRKQNLPIPTNVPPTTQGIPTQPLLKSVASASVSVTTICRDSIIRPETARLMDLAALHSFLNSPQIRSSSDRLSVDDISTVVCSGSAR